MADAGVVLGLVLGVALGPGTPAARRAQSAEERGAGSWQRASNGKGIAKAMQGLAKKEGKGKARSEGPEQPVEGKSQS